MIKQKKDLLNQKTIFSLKLTIISIYQHIEIFQILQQINNIIQYKNISLKMNKLKKSLIQITQTYLNTYPVPLDISLYRNALKLTYSYTIPFTNSKNTFQTFYPISIPQPNLQLNTPCDPISKRLNYDEKGNRIELTNSFHTASVQAKHQKVIQDSVFGKAQKAQKANKWVYIAKLKQDKSKSIFDIQDMGDGKKSFEGDFGETYDGVNKVGIFVWDVDTKKVHALQIDNKIIPACPVFGNQQGTKILFHGYKKQDFPFGILHCFNRPVQIYEASYLIEEAQKQVQVKGKMTKKKQFKVKTQIQKLQLENKNQTNIFPNLSPCFNYLIFFQGKGITHTYYLDLVIMKKGQDNKWKQTHRVKQKFIGYYDTFQSHMIKQGDKTFLMTQTIQNACQKIYQIDLQSGQIINFSKNNDKGTTYSISESINNMLLGIFVSHQQRSFFYTHPDTLQIHHIDPLNNKKFIQAQLTQFSEPIPGFYLQLKEEYVYPEFKHNTEQGKRPLIINIHGGPHGAITPSLSLTSYILLKCGYSILMPNASGSAGFGHQFLTKSLTKPGSANSQQIINLLSKILKQKPQISAQRVHIMGGSYGGYMTAYLGSHHPKYFKSGVVLNGVLSILGQLWYTDIPEWSIVQGAGHQNLFELKEQDYVKMWKQSPISQPMKIPTLQILGAKDRRVPWRQGLLFHALAKSNGTEIETLVYENSGHSLMDSVQTSIDYIMKIIMFFEKDNWAENQQKQQEKIEQK